MINIIHICVFYINIEMCIYNIVLKNLNIIRIYQYTINIYFELVSIGIQVVFDNIQFSTFYSSGKVTIQTYFTHSSQVD
jgi:hypothetical protein